MRIYAFSKRGNEWNKKKQQQQNLLYFISCWCSRHLNLHVYDVDSAVEPREITYTYTIHTHTQLSTRSQQSNYTRTSSQTFILRSFTDPNIFRWMQSNRYKFYDVYIDEMVEICKRYCSIIWYESGIVFNTLKENLHIIFKFYYLWLFIQKYK